MNDIDKAIEIVKHSQSTHQQWVKWIDYHENNNCLDDCEVQPILETAGDRMHHESCIARYQFVIKTLESLREVHDIPS